MGQQQMIMLALAALIVALSIYVFGIGRYTKDAAAANEVAVLDDVLNIATRAQRWYRKPVEFGGGSHSFANVSLDTLNFKSPNVNGEYDVAVFASGDSLRIIGTGTEDPNRDGNPLQVTISVGANGVSPATVEW